MLLNNLVYTHPGQPQMQVEVILASKTDTGAPSIYTIRMRYPRPIHGEIMTHRLFSRNARSSRAVPVKTMLDEVKNIPYVPWHWGKNQKGMQASEDCNEPIGDNTREEAWLWARDCAAITAAAFMEAGYHKQNPNRLLEPFSWMDTLITSTEWSNFLWLRQHHAAEPHLQDLANLVAQAINEANLQFLSNYEWHLPYITEDDKINYHTDVLKKLSAARCARISYKPFNGDSSTKAEIDRYNLLVTDERVHASPLEHQATPDQYDPDYPNTQTWANSELHGNFTGWIQARKMVPNEVYHG